MNDILKEQKERENSFNYQLLSRLKSDCEYYLGYGNRSTKRLWAGGEAEQIAKMKELHNGFAEDSKPEWLTWEEILEYEVKMMEKPEPKKLVLTYVTTDSWGRPVYKDENGNLFKDTDSRAHIAPVYICTVYGGVDGEPDTPIRYMQKYQDAEIEFIPERKTY